MSRKQVTVTRQEKKEKRFSPVMPEKHRVREGILILILAISAYLLIALTTYHMTDPGWSSSGSGGLIANAGGRAGAWVADLLITLFGYMAYLFPIMLAASSWFILFGGQSEAEEEEEEKLKHRVAFRLIGFALTLIASCALFDFYQSFHVHLHTFNAGGILGNVVDTSLIEVLSFIGTGLILIAFFLAGITLFTGWSWFLMTKVGSRWFMIACRRTWLFLGWLRESYADWRARARKKNLSEAIEKSAAAQQPPAAAVSPSSEYAVALQAGQPIEAKRRKIRRVNASEDGLPPLTLLEEPKQAEHRKYTKAELDDLSQDIEKRLLDFGVEANVVSVHPGPVITRFELELAPGLKVSKVSSLVKDLARALSVSSVRVVEVIPGKSVIGFEIPNMNRDLVYLKSLFVSGGYRESPSPLTLALGKDIGGYPVVVDLKKMPHVLIAGTTGSGKSMCVNAMLFSILFKATPDEVRLIMVDPKMLELSTYDGIPHLLTPVVTDMKEAANAFRWCIGEMERRYKLLSSVGVRNLAGFNAKVSQAIEAGAPLVNPMIPEIEGEERATLNTLPNIVVVVDELADLMMVTGKKVEELITRIAQKARAVGIHMILATQRPSVDVITGLIKANIPTRVAFQVSSRIDSRTILDQPGAEQLLGYGDMLYLPPGTSHPIRVHGGYVSDDEVHRLVGFLREQGEPDYHEEILECTADNVRLAESDGDNERDDLYDMAIRLVTESRRASISYVQRRLKIGYNRAAGIIEDMERDGVVSEPTVGGSREVLAPPPVGD